MAGDCQAEQEEKRKPLKAPFPFAGGKSRVADLVWARLGNVQNYCEPFAGTLAVLLRRPMSHFAGKYRVETCNDLNHYLVNFWRAVAADPETVAKFADWQVTEADLHARHQWLVRSAEAAEWREKMRTDPHHFDAKIAGWWVWGQCAWIGGAWCSHKVGQANMPKLDDSQQGVHSGRPQLTDAYDIGRGVNGGANLIRQIPDLTADSARGVHGLIGGGTCEARREWVTAWMRRISDRTRIVRTCYGHWSRICNSNSTLTRLGLTGVFLDPPYPTRRGDNGERSRDGTVYATDKGADLDGLRDEVLAWCVKWGGDPKIRAVVCGYDGDGYERLVKDYGWTETAWEASGGYGNQRKGGQGKAENAKRERLWFSPACLPVTETNTNA